MHRLVVLITALICLAFPTGIAYGACNSNAAVDQELDQGIPVLVVDADGNPLGCGRLVPRNGAVTRQYDPSTGTFTSPDPVEWPVGKPYMNAYQYGFNNPLMYTDPSGAWPQIVKDVANSSADVIRAPAAAAGQAYYGEGGAYGAAAAFDALNPAAVVRDARASGMGWGDSLNQINPGLAILNAGDACLNGGPKPRSDAAMVSRQQSCVNAGRDVLLAGAGGLGGARLGAAGASRYADAMNSPLYAVHPSFRPRPGRAPEFSGGTLRESNAMDAATDWLGAGYTEVSSGRYVSADGSRVVRYGSHEVGSSTHHIHFEAVQDGHVIENTRAVIVP